MVVVVALVVLVVVVGVVVISNIDFFTLIRNSNIVQLSIFPIPISTDAKRYSTKSV